MLQALKHFWHEFTRDSMVEAFERRIEADRKAREAAAAALLPHGFHLLSSSGHSGLTFWKDGQKLCISADEANSLVEVLNAQANPPSLPERP